MRPIITLISEIPKAHPKPIFLFLPRQPAPYANATAITIKKESVHILLYLFILNFVANIVKGLGWDKCVCSTSLVEV